MDIFLLQMGSGEGLHGAAPQQLAITREGELWPLRLENGGGGDGPARHIGFGGDQICLGPCLRIVTCWSLHLITYFTAYTCLWRSDGKERLTRPSILCVTHQMSRKKRDYSVDWTVPYEMMNYKWYLMVLGQYMTILAGTWSVYVGTAWY